MKRPLLSIVIPTCDRPDTLEVCLRALAKQNNPDVEIVIQNNASDERTTDVISRVADPRIIHHRAENRISIRNNFEDAVAAANGEYISIIGDDDAFCAGAIDWIVDMLEQYRPIALRWTLAAYYWPSLSDANLGYFHLHYHYFYGGWAWGDARDLMQTMLDGTMTGLWESLQIYHGVVSRELCEETRNRTGGTLFHYHIPDVYVHTTLLLTAGARSNRRYIDVSHPLSIYGLSGHSTGTSWYAASAKNLREESPVANWERWAATDAKVKSEIQNSIRCVKYHDYAALMLADTLGLLQGRAIDHERWHAEILQEVNVNQWQIKGFHEAEPALPYEVTVVGKVKERFKLIAGIEEPPRLKHLYSDCWRWHQLCNVSAAQGMPDDVETAVVVLDRITDFSAGVRHESEISKEEQQELCEALKQQVHDLYMANPPILPHPPPQRGLLKRARRLAGRLYRKLLPSI